MFAAIGKTLSKSAPAMLGALLCAVFAATRCEAAALRVAVVDDYRPYVYVHQGKLTGIDVEIAQMIARRLGRELEVVTVTFPELIECVKSRRTDMAMTALAVTEERRRFVNFSDPYEFAGMTFLVRAAENIRHIPDMKERSSFLVGVEMGSTAYELIDRDKEFRLVGYSGNREAVQALLNFQNDAVLMDYMVALMMQLEHPDRLVVLSDKLNHEEFAVAVNKKDAELLRAANEVIHELWKSAQLRELQQKHVKQASTDIRPERDSANVVK